MSFLRPLQYPLILLAIGYAGILASLATLRLVVDLTGPGLVSTILRLASASTIFILWLYTWHWTAKLIRTRALKLKVAR